MKVLQFAQFNQELSWLNIFHSAFALKVMPHDRNEPAICEG